MATAVPAGSPPAAAAISIVPAPSVIVIFVPSVNVALVNVLPVELPINKWPSV